MIVGLQAKPTHIGQKWSVMQGISFSKCFPAAEQQSTEFGSVKSILN